MNSARVGLHAYTAEEIKKTHTTGSVHTYLKVQATNMMHVHNTHTHSPPLCMMCEECMYPFLFFFLSSATPTPPPPLFN